MTLWYVARGAGLAALLLLTVTTCLGAVMSRRGDAGSRVVLHYVHRVTATLGLGVLGLHIATILADSYAGVGWRGALVPLLSGYRPNWVALGTFAGYAFVFAAAIGFARARFASSHRATRLWRWLHGVAYLGWGAAMLHGFGTGTDSGLTWVRCLYLACAGAVVGSVALRLTLTARRSGDREPALPRASALATTGGVR